MVGHSRLGSEGSSRAIRRLMHEMQKTKGFLTVAIETVRWKRENARPARYPIARSARNNQLDFVQVASVRVQRVSGAQ